ncbi:MAG: OmpH family outer membrane protein [Rubrivivax sp.]|nr:OmpH family outer membrane protein [Rubrivivax sp.]
MIKSITPARAGHRGATVRRAAAAALLGGAALALGGAAWAQDAALKIGYVNADRLTRDSAPAKAAQAKLEAEFGKRDRELNEAASRLKAAADRLDKEGPTLAESERTRRQRELVEQDRDLTRKRREFQEDLNARRNEELAAIVERANRVIRQIFEQEKFDLILQEAIMAGPRVDITDKVIRALATAPPAGGK